MTPDNYLTAFADQLNRLAERRLLTQDWLLKDWNDCSWLHARIWGALVRSVPPLYTPMVDVKWSGMFKPDLCICDGADKTIAVVEYESTNSSDERLVVKDLRHIEDAILAELRQGEVQTRWWMLISTLPNRSVKWPRFYDWGEGTLPAVKSQSKRNENPLAYYRDGVLQGLGEICERLTKEAKGAMPCLVVWANMDEKSLTVLNVNGHRPEKEVRFAINLPA